MSHVGLHFTSQELKGLKEGEDPEDGPEEEGVTFDVWKKTELPPPLEPVFDEVHLLSSHFYSSSLPNRNSDPGSQSRLFFPLPSSIVRYY